MAAHLPLTSARLRFPKALRSTLCSKAKAVGQAPLRCFYNTIQVMACLGTLAVTALFSSSHFSFPGRGLDKQQALSTQQ